MRRLGWDSSFQDAADANDALTSAHSRRGNFMRRAEEADGRGITVID